MGSLKTMNSTKLSPLTRRLAIVKNFVASPSQFSSLNSSLDSGFPFTNDHPVHARLTDDDSEMNEKDVQTEALVLLAGVAAGICFNSCIILSILIHRRLRRMTSAFIFHHAILGVVKSCYLIPFAHSVLYTEPPPMCVLMGGSYVVLVTASTFNMIAMVCCEVYFFGECNIGNQGKGSICCVSVAFLFVYVAAVIVHLGPTVIAGNFAYNADVGNCIFLYSEVRGYVAHVVWFCITNMAIIAAIYYTVIFYRLVKANEDHRLTTLVRASVDITRGQRSADKKAIAALVSKSLSRTRVLALTIGVFVAFWYPWFICVLFDSHRKFKLLHKIISYLAWSHPAFDPLIFLCVDGTFNVVRQLGECRTIDHGGADHELSDSARRPRPSVVSIGRKGRQNLKNDTLHDDIPNRVFLPDNHEHFDRQEEQTSQSDRHPSRSRYSENTHGDSPTRNHFGNTIPKPKSKSKAAHMTGIPLKRISSVHESSSSPPPPQYNHITQMQPQNAADRTHLSSPSRQQRVVFWDDSKQKSEERWQSITTDDNIHEAENAGSGLSTLPSTSEVYFPLRTVATGTGSDETNLPLLYANARFRDDYAEC